MSDKASNKIVINYRGIVFFFWLLVSGSYLIFSLIANMNSNYGQELNKINIAKDQLVLENMELEYNVLMLSSLRSIREKAIKMGFQESKIIRLEDL